jgi:hypothetical protein
MFTGGTDGNSPNGLALGSVGRCMTTETGGASNLGTVFELVP